MGLTGRAVSILHAVPLTGDANEETTIDDRMKGDER